MFKTRRLKLSSIHLVSFSLVLNINHILYIFSIEYKLIKYNVNVSEGRKRIS